MIINDILKTSLYFSFHIRVVQKEWTPLEKDNCYEQSTLTIWVPYKHYMMNFSFQNQLL
jgi:hypothetical protein